MSARDFVLWCIVTASAVALMLFAFDEWVLARDREPQINECHVTREGSRPGEYEREYWQSFECADDGYQFTLVWGEATIRNTFGNALREEES